MLSEKLCLPSRVVVSRSHTRGSLDGCVCDCGGVEKTTMGQKEEEVSRSDHAFDTWKVV